MPLNGPQIRAARGLLGWNQKDLQARTGLAISTIRSVEKSTGNSGQLGTWRAIQDELEKAGVIFEPEDPERGLGVGVRMRISESPNDI